MVLGLVQMKLWSLQSRKYHLIEADQKPGLSWTIFSESVAGATQNLLIWWALEKKQHRRLRGKLYLFRWFQFQSKVKSAILIILRKKINLSEKLADDLFDDNLTFRLSFVRPVKSCTRACHLWERLCKSPVEEVRKSEIVICQMGWTDRLNNVYEDAESVEFILNENGTYSIPWSKILRIYRVNND